MSKTTPELPDATCLGCGGEPEVSILIVRGRQDLGGGRSPRWFLPSQAVREEEEERIEEQWFCQRCMDLIEDNFRASILYLQVENGLVVPVPVLKEDPENPPQGPSEEV